MKTFNDLKLINVNDHIEKKGGLSYLSWSWAVDKLLENDPAATWEFSDPKYFGKTMMVFCEVTAFGKTMKMHLPVMDNRNNAVIDPDSRKISDAMMRCLAKCIACFGIGLYIYAGEDLPGGETAATPTESNKDTYDYQGHTAGQWDNYNTTAARLTPSGENPGGYVCKVGKKYAGKTLSQIGFDDVTSYKNWIIKNGKEKNKEITGEWLEFIIEAEKFLMSDVPF